MSDTSVSTGVSAVSASVSSVSAGVSAVSSACSAVVSSVSTGVCSSLFTDSLFYSFRFFSSLTVLNLLI